MTTMTVPIRLALRQAVEPYSESIVSLADITLAFEMMRKLLNYDGYDSQQRDYYIEQRERKWYREELRQKGRNKPREPRPVMETSQINNFLGVTLETSSPAVVENWVRYQMGRKETRKAWGNTGLGEQVVADIHKIKQEIAGPVAEQAFGDRSGEHVRQAHIALVQLYAGYLKRWFVARGGQK